VKQRQKGKPEGEMSDRLGARIIKEINLKKKGSFLFFEKINNTSSEGHSDGIDFALYDCCLQQTCTSAV